MKRLALIIGLLMTTISAWATPPSVPTGLAVVTNTATSVNLTWNAVTGVGIKYNIFQNGTLLGSNGATTAQVSGLVNGVSYGFGVQAFNINNETSAVSAYVTITAGAGLTPTGQVQNVYCVNCTSGGGGGGGGGAVTQGTIPWVSSFSGALPTGSNTIGNVNLNAGVNYIGAIGISGTALSYLQSISSSAASLAALQGTIDPAFSYSGSQPTLNVSAFMAARNNTTTNIELLTLRQPGVSFNSDASLNVNSTLYVRDPSNTTSIPLEYGQQAMTSSLPVVWASDAPRLAVSVTAGTLTLSAGTNTTMIGGVNVSQMNGVAVAMGAGATGTGVQRVVLATGGSALPAGTAFIGSVNVSNTAAAPVIVAGTYAGSTDGDTPETGQLPTEAYQMVFNGTTWDRQRGSTTGSWVQGPVSSTVTVAGNPVLSGLRAATTIPTAVSDGTSTFQMADKVGRTIVMKNAPRERKTKATITLSTTAETTFITAGGAGVFKDIDTLVASNGSTQTVRVDFRDVTAGSVIFPIWLAPGGGFTLPVGSIIPQTTAANNWTAQLSTGITTNDVRIFGIANDSN